MLLGEVLARALSLDRRLIGKAAYYQGADLDLHRVSSDPELHYELRPGSSALMRGVPVSVNSLGFRGRERAVRKPAGVYRIMVFGGSTTYGAGVADSETYPAKLEALLGPKFEVWNGGVSAYVLSQNVAQARAAMRQYAPDLIVFQIGNCGRRAFLKGHPVLPFFDLEPALWKENLTLSGEPRGLTLYRSGVIAANALLQGNPCTAETQERNIAAFERLAAEKGVKLALFTLPELRGVPRRLSETGVPALDLRARLRPEHGPEYKLFHPPAKVFDWYAEELAAFLRREGLVP